MFILTFQLCLQQSVVSPVNTVVLLPLPHDKCLASKHKLTGAEKNNWFFLALQGLAHMQVLQELSLTLLQGYSKHSPWHLHISFNTVIAWPGHVWACSQLEQVFQLSHIVIPEVALLSLKAGFITQCAVCQSHTQSWSICLFFAQWLVVSGKSTKTAH